MLKGMGVGAIIKLVLAIMVASLFISISTVGSIGQALSQSFEDIERVSGEKGVEIENAQDLGWVLTLTRDRALNRGCEIVAERNDQDGGYPGLEGSYLTRYPPCYGGDAGLMRGIGGVANPGGLGADENFMPGIYSREKIEITENISFGHDDIAVKGNEEEYLGFPFQGDPRANVDNVEINNEDGDANILVTTAGSAAAGAGVGTFTAGPIGTAGGFVIGGLGGFAGAVINNHQNKQPEITRPMLFYEEGSIINRSTISQEDVENADDADDLPGIESQEFYLCEGDEGYVQANRGHLDEFGQSDKSPLIPMIVIDDIQYESCDGSGSSGSSGSSGPSTVTGTVTTNPAVEQTGSGSGVLDKSGGQMSFEPGESSGFSDYLVWQPLPAGDKTVEIVLEFGQRGHLQIDAQESGDSASNTVSYINTDRNGNEHLWLASPGSDVDTGYDYPLNQEITVALERSGGEISWEVSESGSVKWSHTENSPDFRRLVFESWTSEAPPVVEIRNVEVTQN